MAKPSKPQSVTHKSVTFRAPPGTRFTMWGSDLLLQYERGKSRQVASEIVKWTKETLIPEALREESGLDDMNKDDNPEIARVKAYLEELEAEQARKREEKEKEVAAKVAAEQAAAAELEEGNGV